MVSIVTWLVVDGKQGYLGSQDKYEEVSEKPRAATSWSDLIAIYFALSTCPLICSTLTPLTLLIRGTGPAFSAAREVLTRISNASRLSTISNTLFRA